MPRILLTQAIHPQAEQRLAALGDVIIAADTLADTLRRSARDCDVIVVRAPLPDDIFAAAPSLIGAVRHGAGVDMIPVAAASAEGVLVANVPGVNAVSVAEHVVLKLLQLARRGAAIDVRLRAARSQQDWHASRSMADGGFELGGRTIGLVGHGHVGQAVGRICAQGFSMRVLAYTRHGTRPDATPWLELAPSLAALLAQCDFVVLACPLNDQTRGLIGAAEFAQMRRGAFLVNVARGPVVQTEALLAALRSGQLGGAALDVFDVQPLPDDHPLWAMDNVLLTPHIAGITDDSMRRMGEGAALAVASLLRGDVPANCINPQAAPAFRQRWASRPPR
jgi:D-3-phosphoglycerate dehydrogenase / 2-oxoglutarate reductase